MLIENPETPEYGALFVVDASALGANIRDVNRWCDPWGISGWLATTGGIPNSLYRVPFFTLHACCVLCVCTMHPRLVSFFMGSLRVSASYLYIVFSGICFFCAIIITVFLGDFSFLFVVDAL